MKKTLAGLLVVLSMTACNQTVELDKYAKPFQLQVSIGDHRSQVILAMGQPDSVQSLEVPLVKMETMTWKSYAGGHVYIVHVAMGRVVAKTVI